MRENSQSLLNTDADQKKKAPLLILVLSYLLIMFGTLEITMIMLLFIFSMSFLAYFTNAHINLLFWLTPLFILFVILSGSLLKIKKWTWYVGGVAAFFAVYLILLGFYTGVEYNEWSAYMSLALFPLVTIIIGSGLLDMKKWALYGYAIIIAASLYFIFFINIGQTPTSSAAAYYILPIFFIIGGPIVLWIYRKQFK